MDVAGVDECPPVTVIVLSKMDGRVESVGVAVREHPGQTRVFQKSLHLGDLILHRGGTEKTVIGCRTLGFIILGLGSAGA